MTDEPRSTEEREFEDLSLAEAIGDLLRQPFETVRRLFSVTDPARQVRPMRVQRPLYAEQSAASGIVVTGDGLKLSLLLIAFLLAMIGNIALFQPGTSALGRLELRANIEANAAFVWWAAAVLLVVVALRYTGSKRFEYEDEYQHAISDQVGMRLMPLLAAVPLLLLAFVTSTDNQFTVVGVAAWAAGIASVVWSFTPDGVNPFRAIRRGVRVITANERWVAIALVVIMLVAGYARLNGLDGVPAEMTSDHIEKVQDAQRVLEGDHDIFFANNQGREPFQMYFIAFLASITGSDVTFNHLKMAAAIESWLGVLVMFALGRVAVGERDRKLGLLLGLTLALFAAVGYWHLAITRVSLRIMLTPLVTSVFLIYLMRLIRHNRREDAVMLGLSLGAGLYAYQALRMLPIVAVIAVLYMLLFVARDMRQRWAAIFNLFVIAAVSFAVFIPLFKYSTEHPEEFWRRAQGRLLGENIITETLPDGSIINRSPTLGERVTAFAANIPAIGSNVVYALGLFTFRGDVAWLHNAPNYPAFDPVMGALLITGTAGWVIWAVQKREYAALFLLPVLVLMLIPSVLAIANVGENPSHTRASGAMPTAYLFAAFGAVGIVLAMRNVIPPRFYRWSAVLVLGLVGWQSLNWSNMVLFGPYDDFYQNSWSPQREAGYFMRGVAESDGAWGNVFILEAAHFFDYRGVALDAGVKPNTFENGNIVLEKLPLYMLAGLTTEGQFRLDPDRYMVVIYSVMDEAAFETLSRWFPEGRDMIINTRRDTPWLINEPFRAYRIPPMGLVSLTEFLESQGLEAPPLG